MINQCQGREAPSQVTAQELAYLASCTSNVQVQLGTLSTQLNGKQPTLTPGSAIYLNSNTIETYNFRWIHNIRYLITAGRGYLPFGCGQRQPA